MFPELISDALLRLLALTLIHGTALALLTWAAEVTVLRRCRPSVKAALWTVVLVKFLMPPLLPGSYGLSAMIGPLSPRAEKAVSAASQGPASEHADDTNSARPGSKIPTFTEGSRPHRDLRSHLPSLLLFSYAALLLLLTSKALLRSRSACLRVRRLPAADEVLTGEVSAPARRLGLRRTPLVKLDSGAVSPYVIGVWRPKLVLPAGLGAQLDPRAREALIVHELAHIRRGDLLVRWLQNAARLCFFFWPPVWWLCRRIERFTEMACDQWAVRFSTAGPQLYAETLLDVAKGVKAGAMMRHEVGFAAHRSNLLAKRFELILNGAHDASPRLSWQVSAVLIGWGLFALTGRGVPGVERHPRVAGDAPTGLASSMLMREESASAGGGRAHAALADAPQERVRRRGRAETRARGTRRTELAGAAADEGYPTKEVGGTGHKEIAAVRPSGAQDQRPETASHPDDLNGDGSVSHFEAGFSAGRRYHQRRRSLQERRCDSCEPCAADCAAAERRREIELRARRL